MTYYLEEEDFENLFSEMKPIVMKLMKQIRIRTWKIEDYLQEGMIILHLLLEEQSDGQKLHNNRCINIRGNTKAKD